MRMEWGLNCLGTVERIPHSNEYFCGTCTYEQRAFLRENRGTNGTEARQD